MRTTRWVVAALVGVAFVAGGFVAGLAASGPEGAAASEDARRGAHERADERRGLERAAERVATAGPRGDRGQGRGGTDEDRGTAQQPARGWPGHLPGLSAVAEALGLDADAFLEALADGSTVAEAAADQGVARDDLVSGIVDLATARLSGLPAHAAERVAQHLPRLVEKFVDANPRPSDRGGFGDRPSPRGGLGTLADVIGIPVEELRAALAAGATPAEVAAEHGVARDALVDALVDEARTRIEAWVDGEGSLRSP